MLIFLRCMHRTVGLLWHKVSLLHRSVHIQIIKYTLYMTNLTFQKEGSQFHWMYDLINEFYTQIPYLSLAPAQLYGTWNFCSRTFEQFFPSAAVVFASPRHDFIMGNINAVAPSLLSIRWFPLFHRRTQCWMSRLHAVSRFERVICVILCRRKFRDHNEIYTIPND